MNYLAHLIIAVIAGFFVSFLIRWITGDHELVRMIMLIIIMLFPVHCHLYELEHKLKRLGLKL